jgi:hypothetical protein
MHSALGDTRLLRSHLHFRKCTINAAILALVDSHQRRAGAVRRHQSGGCHHRTAGHRSEARMTPGQLAFTGRDGL